MRLICSQSRRGGGCAEKGGDACVALGGENAQYSLASRWKHHIPHLSSLSLNRPPTMSLNRHINLFHQLNRLRQRCHNPLVMLDILKRQSSPLVILQPFLTHLVAADMEIPHLRRYPLKIL